MLYLGENPVKFVANGNLFDTWFDVVTYARDNKLIIKGMSIIQHLSTIRYKINFHDKI